MGPCGAPATRTGAWVEGLIRSPRGRRPAGVAPRAGARGRPALRAEGSLRVPRDPDGGLGRGAHQFAPEKSARRLTIQRASMLTASVITKSTRPLAMRVLIPRPVASGNRRAMFDAIVEGLELLIRFSVAAAPPESTIATAIVSPSARPRPSIAPAMTPDLP